MGGLLGAGELAFLSCSTEPDLELPVLVTLPDFGLTERSNRSVSLADLRGKVWVANFVFTSCTGPCPLLSAQMKGLQTELKDVPGVALVSFSVDPDTDTPEVLARYAAGFEADPERWLFLTGQRHPIYDLIRSGFKLAVQGDGGGNPGGRAPAGQILHTLRFALVDKSGRVRGYFDGTDPALSERIVPAVARLLGELD